MHTYISYLGRKVHGHPAFRVAPARENAARRGKPDGQAGVHPPLLPQREGGREGGVPAEVDLTAGREPAQRVLGPRPATTTATTATTQGR